MTLTRSNVKLPQPLLGAASIFMMLLTAGQAHAELLVYEPFAYTNTVLTGQGGALGTTNAWASWDSSTQTGWALHQEGVASGVILSDGVTASAFNGAVDNLPTEGGYVGFNQGGNNLTADIALQPSVTATFLTGTVTWVSFVSARAWNLNEEHPNLVLAADAAPAGSRGDVYSGTGFGTGGGPTRNNRTTIFPMFYTAGQYNNVKGAIPGNSYGEATFEVPVGDRFTWLEFEPGGAFGAPNVVVMKLEWDMDGGKDILSLARFAESDTLTEDAFDALIQAQPNLSTANWAEALKPDIVQANLDTITFMGIKYFVDEIRMATSFEEVVGQVIIPPTALLIVVR